MESAKHCYTPKVQDESSGIGIKICRRVVAVKEIVPPPWSSWHPCRNPTKTFSSRTRVFIPVAVDFHSRRVVSVKMLSKLLCNFCMGLQFSRLGVEFLHQTLYEFAIFIRVCNSHITCSNTYLGGTVPLSLWPWSLELHVSHCSPWKTKNKVVLSKIDFCLLLKSINVKS